MITFTKSLTLAVSLIFIASLALATTAGAKTINGTKKNDVLVGTNKADRIDGKAGNDKISGKAGNDTLNGGKGKDKINAGTGDDKIKVKDGKVDTVTCGAGKDVVTADSIDKLAKDCEVPAPPSPTPTAVITLVVTGGGAVTSSPAGITCGSICAGAFNVGTSVTLTATPSANQAFAGWGGACTGTGACVVTADVSKGVTASFVPVKHALNVSIASGPAGSVSSSVAGINCPGDCSEEFDHDTVVSLNANPPLNVKFGHWSGDCIGTDATACVVTMDAARNVTAHFEMIQYTVTAAKSGSGTGSVTSTPAGINCGATCSAEVNSGDSITLTAAASADSTFAGWSGGGCYGVGTCVVTPTAATSVTATFTLSTYTLSVTNAGAGDGTVTSAPSGINCGIDCNEVYNHGTSVTLTATASSGSTFAGWSGGCTGTGTCITSVTAATSVTATFNVDTHLLTVSTSGAGGGTVTSSPAGISCGVDCSEDYNHGTSVTLTAAASAGSTFAGWSGACTGTGTCVVSLTAASSVTATFTPTFNTLTVTKSGTGSGLVTSAPAGINCGGDCSEAYLDGTMVTLTAAASVGSNFTGWSGGGCSGTGSCVVTPASATTVTATFTLSTYMLTVSKTGSGTGFVSSSPAGIACGADCSESINHGTTVTLTASPAVGSNFVGWSGGGCTGTGTCTVAMTTAASVTATFTIATYTLTVGLVGSGDGQVTSSPSGITCGVDCTENYLYGATVTLTADAQFLSTFDGWLGACSGTSTTCIVSMTEARNVTAIFN